MAMPEIEIETREDPARHYDWGPLTSGSRLWAFSVVLYGWAATETTGAATAAVDIYDNDSASGLVCLPIRLASGESAESWYGSQGIWFKNGLYINVTSGSAKGTIFYRHARR